jgi:hypothetical protein
MIIAVLISLSPSPTCAATFEFEGPYAIREIAQGVALEIAGTFSWALPQQVGVALAQQSNVRAVYLDSPGGHIKAALEVADLIRAHNLDTYVSHLCASACTIAFLAGRRRFVSEAGRLGFHQAYEPSLSSEQSSLLLRRAYQQFLLPSAFVAHILRTPPEDLWIPDLAELRKAGIITAVATDNVAAASDLLPPHGLIESATTPRQ